MSVDAASDDHAGGRPSGTQADAIALFQQCAQRAHPDFDLNRELVYVQRICRLVDGAPLAIELAAAWLKALPCEQVAQELTRNIDILATSLRNVPRVTSRVARRAGAVVAISYRRRTAHVSPTLRVRKRLPARCRQDDC